MPEQRLLYDDANRSRLDAATMIRADLIERTETDGTDDISPLTLVIDYTPSDEDDRQ